MFFLEGEFELLQTAFGRVGLICDLLEALFVSLLGLGALLAQVLEALLHFGDFFVDPGVVPVLALEGVDLLFQGSDQLFFFFRCQLYLGV